MSSSTRSYRSPSRRSYRSRSREHTKSDNAYSDRKRHNDRNYKDYKMIKDTDIKNEYRSNNHEGVHHSHHKHRNSNLNKRFTEEEELLEARRQEREVIGITPCINIWGKSPTLER